MKQWLILLYSIFLHVVLVSGQEDSTPTPQWRPRYHFTPLRYWTNDPNGLIFRQGVYHLYNQQNPYGNQWGHMSWGHATSTDLIHWKHLPVAMVESLGKDTTLRFSGSVVWDKNNTSGFCKAGGCMVAVYTADQPNLKKESQFVAYSNDGGMHFTDYAGNPVIDLHMKDFRDPNVIWSSQLNKWLMVVALPAEHKVQFYASTNLRQWDLLSDFGPAGYIGANWECPALMQLPVEGKPGKKKWILAVSAAGGERGVFMQYFTGNFDGKKFTNDNAAETILPLDNGDCFYAAIPWNGIPAEKPVFIGWMIPAPQATWPWRGQMSIPRDLSIRQTHQGMRLLQLPADIIVRRRQKSFSLLTEMHTLSVGANDTPITANGNVPENAYWIEADWTVTPDADFGFKIAQEKGTGGMASAETVIGYNATTGKMYVDKTHAGGGKLDPQRAKLEAYAGTGLQTIHMQILLDKSSLELFGNGGEEVITTQIFPTHTATGISAFSNKAGVRLTSLKIWSLR